MEFDVVVIGSGPGGYVAAIRAAQLGLKTACIEKDLSLGGTCLNVGCIPSKALLQSSEYYEWIQKSSKEHGIDVEHAHVNFGQMMARKNLVVKGLVDGVAQLIAKNRVERFHGVAAFKTPNRIEILSGGGNQQIEAKYIILATGSESISLPFLPIDEQRVLTSTGALQLEKIPEKMLVIGAGVIGVELASVYKRLGSEVTVIEMLDRITPTMDSGISKMLLQILKKQGLQFHLSAKVLAGKKNKNYVDLEVDIAGQKQQFQGDVVLIAVGRKPYTEGLNLEGIGVKKNNKGFVVVDSQFRTSIPNIFAIGDIIEGPMLAHRASEEGIAVAEILAGEKPKVHYMSIPNVIYTHPEVAAVGLTEEEAKAAGFDLIQGKCLFKAIGRARCSGEVEGMVKVLGDKATGRLLGLHILGAHASEMIGEGVIAIDKKATVKELAEASHAHPTMSEAIKEACLQALGRPIHQ